ncbi:MAG: PAS domain-containing sensor histidine kinase [Bacteroidota bacterium]|nr:PAS domain-containing sensor histidine kinase [Bacteroidota bacterium]
MRKTKFKRTAGGRPSVAHLADLPSKYMRLLNTARLLYQKKQYLEEAFNQVEDFYNNAPCGLHSLDKDGRFLRINDTELKWLGYTREEFGKEHVFSDFLSEKSKLKFAVEFSKFIECGTARDLEFEMIRKDGTPLPVLLSASAITDKQGNFVMSRSVVLDISASKKAESDLRHSHGSLQAKNEALASANEKLFRMSNEKTMFLDIATHDLQLPLSAISMLSETLIKETFEPGSPEQHQVFELIYDAAREMKSLLSNYLSASQSDAGRKELFVTEFDLSVLLHDICGRFTAVAAKKNISIHFSNTRSYLLFSDRESCQQIIENLLSNAIKYTYPGKNVYLSIERKHNNLALSIRDEGQGISPDERPLLFQRFQKLSARPTAGELSTGLGLSIVKYLVDKLKGDITVESEPGKGSLFTVFLPLEKD